MNQRLHQDWHVARIPSTTPSRKIFLVGLIGGLVGTIIMDLFGAGIFILMGGPASLSFSVIGDAAASFLARLGIIVAGGLPLGAMLHYLIGLVFGVIFAEAILRVRAIRVDSMKKILVAGILYVEAMSLPLLTAAAILLQMDASQTAQWFGISIVMHLVYGAVLGAVVRYGLHPAAG